MILNIKCKLTDPSVFPVTINHIGEWFDIAVSEDVSFTAPKCDLTTGVVTFHSEKVPLGISMHLPNDYEAIIAPRSSLYTKKGLELVNSIGIIDSSFCGDQDVWKAHLKANKNCTVTKGERLVQFRINLSQKASIWTRIKWLFITKINFEIVPSLYNTNRGGYGATGGYN